MPAHLIPLPRCQTCDRPATVMLRNAVDAPLGEFCDRHGEAALRQHQERVEVARG